MSIGIGPFAGPAASDYLNAYGAPPGASASSSAGNQTQNQSWEPTASQIGATAPAPIQAFGPTPQVAPSFANPQDPYGYYTQYTGLLSQGMQPYFQQQQQQLDEDLRARGIQNSGAAGYLEGNLLGQQGATLASQSAPFLSQAFGYGQQDILSNQGAANAANYYNAGQFGNAETQNFDAYNNYQQQLLGLGAGQFGNLQAAYLNSYGPNTGVTSAYNNALSNTGNIYGNVYSSAAQGQGTALGGAFGGLGTYFGDAAAAGA